MTSKTWENNAGERTKDRSQFLLKMYDQLWSNVNRHILVPWQSISVLIATFTVFYLVEKKVLTLDVATTLVVSISSWQIAHVLDASHWVNRNMAIIGNIEREFLLSQDLELIHPYFGAHRKPTMFNSFKIQIWLGVGISILILLYHFIAGICESAEHFKWIQLLPYSVAFICSCAISCFYWKILKKGKKLIENSPGRPLDKNVVK